MLKGVKAKELKTYSSLIIIPYFKLASMFQAELLVVLKHCLRQRFPDQWVSFPLTSQSGSEWFCVSRVLPGRQASKGSNAVSQMFRGDPL